MTTRLTGLSIIVWLASGCALEPYPDPVPEDPKAQEPAVTVEPSCDDAPSYAEMSVFNMCVTCHSSTKLGAARRAAPESINFDTEAAASAFAGRAVNMVKIGAMPPYSTGLKLSDEEKQELYAWAKCYM